MLRVIDAETLKADYAPGPSRGPSELSLLLASVCRLAKGAWGAWEVLERPATGRHLMDWDHKGQFRATTQKETKRCRHDVIRAAFISGRGRGAHEGESQQSRVRAQFLPNRLSYAAHLPTLARRFVSAARRRGRHCALRPRQRHWRGLKAQAQRRTQSRQSLRRSHSSRPTLALGSLRAL